MACGHAICGDFWLSRVGFYVDLLVQINDSLIIGNDYDFVRLQTSLVTLPCLIRWHLVTWWSLVWKPWSTIDGRSAICDASPLFQIACTIINQSHPLLPLPSPPTTWPWSVRKLPNIFKLKHCSVGHCRCFIHSTTVCTAAIVPLFSISNSCRNHRFQSLPTAWPWRTRLTSNNPPEQLLNSYAYWNFKLIYSVICDVTSGLVFSSCNKLLLFVRDNLLESLRTKSNGVSPRPWGGYRDDAGGVPNGWQLAAGAMQDGELVVGSVDACQSDVDASARCLVLLQSSTILVL